MPTDDTHNSPDAPRRSCVMCAHAGLNPPVNLPLACRHPYAPNGEDASRLGTCRIMRGPLGLCGPNAAFWTQRRAPVKRPHIGVRILRSVLKGLPGDIVRSEEDL